MRLPPISQQQPASSNPPAAASQPSQPASQASQPSQPASQASQRCIWASEPQASRHRCLQTLNIGASNRFPQGATGCHRRAQAGKLSVTHSTREAAKHAINPSNIDDMAITCYKPNRFFRKYKKFPPGFFRKYKNPLLCCFLMKYNY